MPIWIDTDEALELVCQTASQQACLALDTEFVWERTYYAQLALIQLSWGQDDCVLIDPLRIRDTAPLAALLENKNIVKLLHEAASDLPILQRWCKQELLPVNIFDTRLAAAFCGMGLSCSLNKLLTDVLQITLEKGETRSDWLQRPLSAKQMQYACEDVLWLPQLAGELKKKMVELGNLSWFTEEMRQFEQPEYYAQEPPEQAWKRFASSAPYMNAESLAVLKALAAWRESKARELDRPRPRLLRDEQLLTLAEMKPRTAAELQRLPAFWPKNIKKYGAEILAAVEQGRQNQGLETEASPLKRLPADLFRKRLRRLQSLVKKRADTQGIDPVLLATRKQLASLVNAAAEQSLEEANMPQGWRAELLGDSFQELLNHNFKE